LALSRSAPARATRASGAHWILKLQHGATLEEAPSPAQDRLGPAPGAAGELEDEGDLAAQDGARVYSATWSIRPRSAVAREAPRASPAVRARLGAGLTSASPAGPLAVRGGDASRAWPSLPTRAMRGGSSLDEDVSRVRRLKGRCGPHAVSPPLHPVLIGRVSSLFPY